MSQKVNCFSKDDAIKASAYLNPRSWTQYCNEQKRRKNLTPSPIALQHAKKQDWWKEYQEQLAA